MRKTDLMKPIRILEENLRNISSSEIIAQKYKMFVPKKLDEKNNLYSPSFSNLFKDTFDCGIRSKNS